MKYKNIEKAVFLSRPNRFIANIQIHGTTELCHVKNTGRCRELLIPGVTVYVEVHSDPKRKTKYSLIAVDKKGKIINMDSQAPNKLVKEWVMEKKPFGEITLLKPETTFGDSRFDFYMETKEHRIFMEVKGVTLEENGVVRFPDAPTERGIKHIMELIEAKKQGYEAYLLFVIQMNGVQYFTPNDVTHKAFGDALRLAHKAGVKILAYDCLVEPDYVQIDTKVETKI